MRRPSLLLCVLALGMLASSVAHAADKLRLERLDLSKSPTIKMYLSYIDAEGRVVSGRQKEEFKLILDSAEQGGAAAATAFDQTQEPINVVLVAQVSTAMMEVVEELKKGVRVIANALSPKSKMAVLGYSSDTKRLAELGPPADAESAANNLSIDTENVEVHLLDAVRTAIDLLNAAPKGQRKMIVLFSDGIDVNMEKKIFSSIGKRAQEGGIVIDTIGFAPFEAIRLRNLSELSKVSYGIERTCKGSSDVTSEFNNLVDEIRKQYVVTFELALAGGDSKTHTFQALVESGGRAAYSNNIMRAVPAATHPVASKEGGRRWWLWGAGIFGGLGLLWFLAWLIFRDRGPPAFVPEIAAPIPAPLPTGERPRTLALDVGGGGGQPALGWIVAVSGRQADQTFKLKPARTVIGSDPACDVVIEDQYMSSRHCEVRYENGAFRICDLGSTNGIVVNNDKQVREHDLVDNDTFRLGRTDFKFKSIVS